MKWGNVMRKNDAIEYVEDATKVKLVNEIMRNEIASYQGVSINGKRSLIIVFKDVKND